MKTNDLENTKAITLIALVVSIIVLLILAGVSIAVLTGENGILNRATSAKQTNEQKTAEEELKLGISALTIDYRKNTTNSQPFKEFVVSNEGLTELKKAMGLAANNTELVVEDAANGVLSYKGQKYQVSDFGGVTEYVPPVYVAEDSSMVGKYADINNDGEIDGIIFADLAVGNQNKSGSNGKGCGLGFEYNIPIVSTGLKKYEILLDTQSREYLRAVTAGTDRFYIVSLSNATSSVMNWYKSAQNGQESNGYMDVSDTSTDFGTGKANSKTIIQRATEATSSSGYRILTSEDMWYLLTGDLNNWTSDMKTWWTTSGYQATKEHLNSGWTDLLKKGWFIPSKGEFAAMKGELNIEAISSADLTSSYWSSSIQSSRWGWGACFVWECFVTGNFGSGYMGQSLYVRLVNTF